MDPTAATGAPGNPDPADGPPEIQTDIDPGAEDAGGEATSSDEQASPESELQSYGSDEASPSESEGQTSVEGTGWRVRTAKNLSTAYLDFERDSDAEPPSAAELLAAASSLGVSGSALYSEQTLDRVISNAVNWGIPLENYALTEDRDAETTITISDDKLQARIDIHKGVGRGKQLDLKELGAVIRRSGLKGLRLDQIKADILAFYRGPDLVLEGYALAKGKEPEPGEAREVTWEVEMLPAASVEKLKQQAREAPPEVFQEIESIDEIPVSDVDDMAFVKAESIIASISKRDPGKPGMDVLGKIIPAVAGSIPPTRILEHLRLGDETIVAECDGVFERKSDDSGTIIRVRPHVDATVTTNISNDIMLGSVVLTRGSGTGLRLTDELVRQSLIGAGVIKGIDMDAIATAIRRATRENDQGEFVVARGQPPIEAGESRLTFHVTFASGKGVTIRSDGTADFKNQDRVTIVEKDQLIAEILSERVEVRDGYDIKSNVVQAKGNADLNLEIGSGIREDYDDSGDVRLFAAAAGELFYDGNSISLGDIRTIQGDVGPATGNVKFGGSVNITGTVHSGFFVVSKGTIKIAEGVNAALISADESIHIQQGIKGAAKAVLRARKEITAGFAEQATIMSIGNTTIQNACLHCNVKCVGKLVLATDKGRLVGGRIRSRDGVVATQIGTPRGVKTSISFGQDYLIGDKIELEEKEIEKLQVSLARLEGEIHAAERDEKAREVEAGRAKKVQDLKVIEKRTERLFWLRERFEQHFPSAVEVRGAIYPGVVLESHGRTLEITTEKRSVVFRFNEKSGHIEETESVNQR